MKKFKRFFASILCVCMIITSCPDILAWAAGDTAVVKTTKFEFSAKKLSKMVQKADKGNTEDNGLCKLSVPKAMNYGKQLKLRAYLQEDEENIVFLFVNKTKKRHAAAIIVDDMMSDIIAVSTKQELLDEEYATDSNSDYDYDVYTDGLLDADFMDMAAEVLDGTSNPSDNDADKEYDHLDGEAFDVVLRDGTVGAALVVSLEALGLDDMGDFLPDDEDDEERSVVIASDSNAGSAVVLPGKDDTAVVVPGADTPVVLPDQDQRPVVVDLPVATPSNSNVTVATPSNVAKTFIQELNGVKIKAHAEAGVIPDEATFEAIELKETGDTADAYKEACETLDADEETEYDGVMAYDLHFLLDGEEIQPDGEVQISMEVSEKVLPENVESDTIEVKHLEETGASVEVKTVADVADKADGTIETNDTENVMQEEETKNTAVRKTAAVTAEFKVNSFSYFAITYKTMSYLNAYFYVDGEATTPDSELEIGDKDKLQFNPGDFGAKWDTKSDATGDEGYKDKGTGSEDRGNRWISIEAEAGLYGKYTNGYTYEGAYADTNKRTPIYWIYFDARSDQKKTVTEGWGWNQTTYTYYTKGTRQWYYSTSKKRPTGRPTSSTPKFSLINNTGAIYLYYKTNADYSSQISDENFETTGCLTYKYDAEPDVEYVWYGSDTGKEGTYEEVTRRRVTGTVFNIVNNDEGTHLYPALDLSTRLKVDPTIRRWYRVEVRKKDGTVVLSKDECVPKQVPYYAALQNGDFEKPDPDLVNPYDETRTNPGGNFDFPTGTVGLDWSTTGEDGQVEIVYDKAGGSYNCTKAASNSHYAELNAEGTGALYQNVLTQPGSTLNWHLSHRGRYGSDTMYLVIAPMSQVDNLKSQTQLEGFIQSKLNGGTSYEDKSGYMIKKFTDSNYDNNRWGYHAGTYEVPASQYMTAFFFVAGNTTKPDGVEEGRRKTLGNLLDAVQFSTELDPAESGFGKVHVRKTIEGINPEDYDKYTVTVTLTNVDDAEDVRSATLHFTEASNYAEYTFGNTDSDKLTAGQKYYISETPGSVDSKYTPEYSRIKIDDNSQKAYNSATENIIEIADEKIHFVEFTNAYKPSYVGVKVKKTVDGNMGNSEDEFDFTITATQPDGTSVNLAGEYDLTSSDQVDGQVTKKSVTATNDGKYTFTLKHNEEINFADVIPNGATVTIKETNYAAKGYTPKYFKNEGTSEAKGDTCIFENVSEDQAVEFVNTRTISIPTGLFDNGHPTGWLYLMAAAAGCFAFGFYRRRKKKLDNGEECL